MRRALITVWRSRPTGRSSAGDDNDYGQTTIPAGLTNVVAIAAGSDYSLALKADGTVVGWGNNFYGQITIPAGLTNVVAIAAGDLHSLALKADGTVVGWGDNSYGETTIPGGLTNVVAIAAAISVWRSRPTARSSAGETTPTARPPFPPV